MWWSAFLVLLAASFGAGASNSAQDVVRTFSSENGAGSGRFNHLVVDKNTGQIYVGAVNQLYQLTQDLEMVQSEMTGPQDDSTECSVMYCPNTAVKRPTDNHNKALVIDYTTTRLITCGSIQQGTCTVRSLQNISDIVQNVREAVVANNAKASTFAFIAPGPPKPPSTHVMYVGVTFTGNSPYRSEVPSIASRSLDPDRMFQIADVAVTTGTRMFVNNLARERYIINYVYGFESVGFSYFLTTQLRSNIGNSPYISKLVRICHDDPNYYSYTEIPITCNSNSGKQYNLVQAGFVGKPGSDLAKDMGITAQDDVLFAVFAERDHPSSSALCIYPLSSIRQTFTQNIRECYSGKGNQGLEYFDSSVKSCVNVDDTIGEDFCGKEVNHPIGGDLPVEAMTVLNFNNRATAVLATSTGNYTVVFIGMENGHLKKVVIENSSYAFEYEDVNIDESAAVNDIQLEPNGTQLYLMTKYRVSKVRVRNCNIYKTCGDCLGRKNPYCGWCLLTNKCTRRSNCQDNGPFSWISYKSFACPQIKGTITGSKELLVAYSSEKVVSVRVSNIVEQLATSQFACLFSINGANVSVNATLLDDKINCHSMNWNFSSRLEPNVNALLTVIWNGSSALDNPDNVHVNIYNCQNLANNSCDLCLNLNDKYKCGWCQNSHRCEIFEHCNNGLSPWLNRNQTCLIPEIYSFHPKSGPWEGGTNVTINGINLGNDFKDIKDDVSVAGIPCQPYVSMYNQTTQIVCQVEHLRGNKSTEGPVTVRIRDFTVQSKDNYQFVDPIIRSISPMQGPSYGGTTLHITGFHLNAGSSIEAFIDNLPCRVISVEYEGAYCITSASDRHGKFKFKIKFDKGTRYLNDGFFEYVEVEDGNVESVALKIAILTIVFLISIGFLNAFQRNFIENTRDLKSIRNRIKILELRVAAECRETFGELQTELTDLREELKTSGIPFLDYRTYAMMILFPNSEHHAVLQFERPELLHKEKGLRLFGQLIMNKTFLLLFIRTLESNRYFSMRDRVNVASLIMLVLQTKMEYCTDILKTLLAQLIDKFMKEKSNPYLLLRQTESVAEKMLSSWFTFLLYRFIREHAGKPLYLLFRAMKQHLDKGPVDAITGEARYSLSESKVICNAIEFKPMTVSMNIDSITNAIEVKVLDCDTISQVKEKTLDTIYRATSYSKRPTKIDDYDIKLKSSGTVLSDFDKTTREIGGWKKMNTLKHYKVPDGACLNLVFKYKHSQSQSTQQMEQGKSSPIKERADFAKKWHIVKRNANDNDQKREEISYKMVSEIYLMRLMATKGTLQKFVDDLFETIFSTEHRSSALSFSIKYMFDFLDEQGTKHRITDPDVVHIWKTNALPLRFWVNLIKNPNFLLDIQTSSITVDSCLSGVAQALVSACSTSDHKLSEHSPSSSFIFAREIPGYKDMINKYYSEIKSLQKIEDQDMNAMLAEESQIDKSQFNTNWALHELYTYVTKYNEQLTVALDEDLAQMLEEVHSMMKAE
uniref:Plexin-A1 n=1 Tax=Cacopsylla melanoneura TaxID=428564 RepID=A0A8D8QDQ6_9HEMI